MNLRSKTQPPSGNGGHPAKPVDGEELLWQLSDLAAGEGGQVPPDDLLDAYRERRLDARARQEVESILLGSAAARARLAELAGVAAGCPPPALRERVLRHAPSRWTPGRLALSALGLAAAVTLAITGILIRSQGVPSGTRYDVAIAGLAEVRGRVTAPADAATAYPSTTVRIEAVPITGATADVTVGLYGLRPGRLERLDSSAWVTVTRSRGAVSFAARAADLVGPGPGTFRIFVAVAALGDLPVALEVHPGEDPASLLAAGRRRQVLVQHITVFSEPSAPGDGHH